MIPHKNQRRQFASGQSSAFDLRSTLPPTSRHFSGRRGWTLQDALGLVRGWWSSSRWRRCGFSSCADRGSKAHQLRVTMEERREVEDRNHPDSRRPFDRIAYFVEL